MSRSCAAHLPIADAATLARLRGHRGLDVCFQDDSIWLRGEESDEKLDKKLRSLPGARFDVMQDGQLIPTGCRVPKGHLPDGSWIALSDALSVEIEPPAFGAQSPGKVELRLVRGGPVGEANLLLTTLKAWAAYADRAAQIRLERLAFAVNEGGDVLVRGTPSPPLPGVRFVEDRGIAAAAGWTWRPSVDADVLRDLFQLDAHDLALLHEDGTWDLVRADDFVRATRSAARLSLEGAGHE